MKLYRVENLSKGNGLWYHINQDYAGTIVTLDLSNKDLPMPFDEQIKQGMLKSAASEPPSTPVVKPTKRVLNGNV